MNTTIALANDANSLSSDDESDYLRQIHAEDGYLIQAFNTLGYRAQRVAWSSETVDWSHFAAVLIRQTWDYYVRYAEFNNWLNRIEHQTRVINPVPVMRWNGDKQYLLELEAQGVAVVPTQKFDISHQAPELSALMRQHGHEEAVIKPAVSGAGRETWRIHESEALEHQTHWEALLSAEAMLYQPFMPDILAKGEVSLIVIGGQVTHAVRKQAATGEFRVQDDHGGTVHPYQPNTIEIQLAEQAIAAVPGAVEYARVDLVDSEQGPRVMELELIEPELFFRQAPEAAEKLAQRVVQHCSE